MTEIPYDEYLAGPGGMHFILQPMRGLHTADDVAAMRRHLRNTRDVVKFSVEWQKPARVKEKQP